ncbi:MAG: GWxTD domain-containing protein [Candidatus Krumholzibacteria bacterium]|nr:GWxTD domain-containing protein [Candidatus Krumholzibacteria bacterium]
MKQTTVVVLALLGLVFHSAGWSGQPRYKIGKADVERLSPQLQETFAGLQYLLTPYQIRHFMSLDTDEDRVQWIELFWKQSDPTPTSPKNEMKVEHTIRAKLAKQFYKSKKWPGWDKRGEVFIRYGPPDYRGKIWGSVGVNKMQPPGELWYYRRHDMLVSFQNFGLQGEYIYSIDPLGIASKISPEFAEFLIYDTSESLTRKIPQQYLEYYSAPAYSEVPPSAIDGRAEGFRLSKPRELDDDIDAVMDPDRVDMLPNDVASVFHKDKIQKIANNFEIALEETPSAYPFNFEEEKLPFYFAVDQFRGGTATNRIDVSVELPVSIESGGMAAQETFQAELVVWDSRYQEVSRQETSIVLRATPEVSKWSSLLPTQIVLSLPRGYYRMGISMRGLGSGRHSSYRTTFTCEPFADDLGISDILFARSIDALEKPSIFARGPLEVVPHPLRAYGRSFPMPIYFELYNLTLDDRGVSSYTLEYKIVPHKREKKSFRERFEKSTPVVASKFQSSGFSRTEPQHIFVHMDNLKKGSYDLLITLTDDVTGQVTFQKGTFSLVD